MSKEVSLFRGFAIASGVPLDNPLAIGNYYPERFENSFLTDEGVFFRGVAVGETELEAVGDIVVYATQGAERLGGGEPHLIKIKITEDNFQILKGRVFWATTKGLPQPQLALVPIDDFSELSRHGKGPFVISGQGLNKNQVEGLGLEFIPKPE